MNHRHLAFHSKGSDSDATASSRVQGQAESARGSPAAVAGRLIAALVMGLVLVVLSGLLHSAAAAAMAGGWSYLWASWSVAIIVTLLIALSAPTRRIAWGRLCAVNGLVSGGVLVASTIAAVKGNAAGLDNLADQGTSFGLARPIGGALGAALLSGALGIAALLLTVVLLAASYVLLHWSARSNRLAH